MCIDAPKLKWVERSDGHPQRKKEEITMKRLVLSAAMLVAGCGGAFAQISMTGTVNPSYQLIISSGSGPTLSGSGTATTSLNLGSGIAFYGTSVTTGGVTQNNSGNTLGSSSGAGGSTLLSFPVTIEVDEANSVSSHFELDAALSAAAATGITVSMGSQATLGTTPLALATSASYGTPAVYTIGISYLTTVTQATTPLSQTISITYNPA